VIKAILIAVVGYAIWLLGGKDEGGYLSVLADHFVAEDLITAGERTALPSLRVRRRARKQAKKQHGRKAANAMRSLQREQVRLVMYHGRYGAGPGTAAPSLFDCGCRVHWYVGPDGLSVDRLVYAPCGSDRVHDAQSSASTGVCAGCVCGEGEVGSGVVNLQAGRAARWPGEAHGHHSAAVLVGVGDEFGRGEFDVIDHVCVQIS
jgi:hypothetical protein